jgi:hypothetical protein
VSSAMAGPPEVPAVRTKLAIWRIFYANSAAGNANGMPCDVGGSAGGRRSNADANEPHFPLFDQD